VSRPFPRARGGSLEQGREFGCFGEFPFFDHFSAVGSRFACERIFAAKSIGGDVSPAPGDGSTARN
jgi:hypothetical protein